MRATAQIERQQLRYIEWLMAERGLDFDEAHQYACHPRPLLFEPMRKLAPVIERHDNVVPFALARR